MALVILCPLAASAFSFLFPRSGRWLSVANALAVGSGLFNLSREVLSRGVQTHLVGGWGAPLGIDLRADGLALLMLILTAGIGAAVSVYAWEYFSAGRHHKAVHRARYFWPLFFFLWTGLNGLFLSADIFNLYVTLELLGFSAVMLVALGGERPALTAAMRYLLVSIGASLFYLLGVGLVYAQCATVDLPLLAVRVAPGPSVWVALGLMTIGLATKAALFPMHFWLPSAHANAPAPVSALLSALVVKGALYILLRLWFEGFHALITPAVAQWIGALGAGAILWGSIKALTQPRLKLLVAYSTVAQLGYLFLLFPLAAGDTGGFTAWSGGLVLLGAHACAKASIFLVAGNILHAAGHDRIRDMNGITHVLPISVFAFALAGMSLAGLPPSSGFAGKWMLLNSGIAQGQWWWVAVILLGSLLAAAYVLRVLSHAFTAESSPAVFTRISPVREWTSLVLALLAVGFGLAATWPVELLRIGSPVAGPALSRMLGQ
jgi:formate hydrogenlyase subunit 3/multisubunit Na+/H+ antiporter MnhD subunit